MTRTVPDIERSGAPPVVPLGGLAAGTVRVAPARDDAAFGLLVLPDWQGATTPYATRMARALTDAIAARGLVGDALLLHPYAPEIAPRAWASEGRALVGGLLAQRARTRRFAADAVAAARTRLSRPDAPLVLVGFCLGGTLAFEAARARGDAVLAVSVHGGPASDPALPVADTRTRFLFVGGDADPMIDAAARAAFTAEMRSTGRLAETTLIAGARHSFTKAEIGAGDAGSAYDPDALRTALDTIAGRVVDLLAPSSRAPRPVSAGASPGGSS